MTREIFEEAKSEKPYSILHWDVGTLGRWEKAILQGCVNGRRGRGRRKPLLAT